jgi:hypothetical protein
MCRKILNASEERKHRKGICITPFCTSKVKSCKKKSGKVYTPLYCSACARRAWAEKNPEKYLYANLRGNARRRGKVFTISFEYFKKFLERENYLHRKRGRTKSSVSVDRPNNSLGYVEGNLKAITIKANSEKRHYVDYFRRMEISAQWIEEQNNLTTDL